MYLIIFLNVKTKTHPKILVNKINPEFKSPARMSEVGFIYTFEL